MNVIKDPFLPIQVDHDRGVPSINGNVLLEEIAINVAEGLLSTACKQQDLFAGNPLRVEKLPYCICAFHAFKSLEATGNLGELLMERR